MGSSEFQDSRFKAGSGFKLETENFELWIGSTESRATPRRIIFGGSMSRPTRWSWSRHLHRGRVWATLTGRDETTGDCFL
jgi:hypothetical protein